jgi:hypothetical protein
MDELRAKILECINLWALNGSEVAADLADEIMELVADYASSEYSAGYDSGANNGW